MAIPHEPAFARDEYESRIAKVRRGMAERGLDGLVVFSPHSIYYLAGMDSENLFDFQCLIVPASGEPTLVILDFEEARAENSVGLGQDRQLSRVRRPGRGRHGTDPGCRPGRWPARPGAARGHHPAAVSAVRRGAGGGRAVGPVRDRRGLPPRQVAGRDRVHANGGGPDRRGRPRGLRRHPARRPRRRGRRRDHGHVLSRWQRHGLLGPDRRLGIPLGLRAQHVQRPDDRGRRDGLPRAHRGSPAGTPRR